MKVAIIVTHSFIFKFVNIIIYFLLIFINTHNIKILLNKNVLQKQIINIFSIKFKFSLTLRLTSSPDMSMF